MAVKELWDSFEAHETSAGTTVRRVFLMFWSDFENPSIFSIFLGDGLDRTRVSTARSNLKVVDVTQTAVSNAYCNVTVLYSTDAPLAKQPERPDQISSWEERLEFNMEEIPVDVFTDNTGTVQSWNAIWD